MAIDERDFFASHGLDFDYKNMLDEYIKGVIKQAKIEVLTETQWEIAEMKSYESADGQDLVMLADIGILFQKKIDKLKERTDEANN